MTREKPPGRTWQSWAEEQIQEAQAEGQFANLQGQGEPIPGLLAPYDPLWWVKKLMERERLSALPPALEIRARVDRELEAILSLASEAHVRERVARLNAEIARVNRSTAEGPPTTLPPLDVDRILADWRRRALDAVGPG